MHYVITNMGMQKLQAEEAKSQELTSYLLVRPGVLIRYFLINRMVKLPSLKKGGNYIIINSVLLAQD